MIITSVWSRFWSWALSVSVWIKVMGIALSMILLLGLGVTLQVRASLRTTLREELRQRGRAIATDVAGRSVDLILTDNLFGLHELTRSTLENNDDVRYVLILDRSNAVLAHTFGEHLPGDLVEANRLSLQEKVKIQTLDTEEGVIYDLAVPILGGQAGLARIGMSERRIQGIVRATTRYLLGVTALVSLVGVLAAYLLTSALTRPILELVRVAKTVGTGDFQQRARVWSRDEIGRLSAAFNAMTEGLARSRHEIEEYTRQLLRRNEELSALNAIAVAVSQSLKLEEILRGALEKTLELMKLRAGWIFIVDGRGHLELVAHQGVSAGFVHEEVERQREDCVCRRLLESGEAQVLEDLRDCPRLSRETVEREGIVSHVSVPLKSRERVLGVMNLACHTPRPFGPDDLRLLTAIGHEIGVAIENARLYEELQHKEEIRRQLLDKIILAQEEERKRIARELHDEIGQSLTALVMSLGSTEEAISPDDHVRARLAEIRTRMAQILEEIRRLMVDLRPSLLDDLGLIPAIGWFAETHLARAQVEPLVEVVGFKKRLPPDIETALFRVVQEAITNIVKHARACRATIRLEFRETSVLGTVEDDGKGFDPLQARHVAERGTGLGLLGMEERVGLLGGSLSIESSPGGGTRLTLKIPLDGEEVNR